MQKFKTLMLREWMQHQRGWLVLLALPFLVVVVVGMFGQVQVDVGGDTPPDMPPPLAMALVSIAGLGGATAALAWFASVLQAPGLARRDVQDRSIEFWLSLPISHSQSVSATLLTHLLLWPMLALAAGTLGGLVASLLLVGRFAGVAAWFTLPWGLMLPALVLLLLRLMLGIALATLWLSPLILGTMAASAWLKRWGVPVVAGAIFAGGQLLDRLYGNPIVWQTLQLLGERASQALIAADRSAGAPKGLTAHAGDGTDIVLGEAPRWLLHDAGDALATLASTPFVAALLVSALAFGLLVLRRRRGA